MAPTDKRRRPVPSARRAPTRTVRRNPPSAPPSPRSGPVIVGLGASAGGLEALKTFFGAMPAGTGLAFVVVVHLDPTHESLMPELVGKATTLTVSAARDRQAIEPEHVYIIPPNRTLTIEQGVIRVKEADRRGLRSAIDHFFRSLAADQGERAIAVVLSGTGTEGTLGAQAVKAQGGLVMAQSPDTASQPGMPVSLIATGLVDLVLEPGRMPAALLGYLQSQIQRVPPPARRTAGHAEGLDTILALLRARTKHEFRGYKEGTLRRRIERRMSLQQMDSLTAYAEYVRSHPSEADQLFKDLLIGVTSFFRDAPAFEELAARVLSGLVRERDPDSPIRVWVPGCSTGEEAYSIAIALAEQITAAKVTCQVQIFATDVDEHALELARDGTYPESIALDVRPERLQRFFTREDHRYTVAKAIRQWVTFAVQNLTSDPPFSRMDLVSCRNVLIYLEPGVQERLVTLFHFALSPGGYLFLGSAEGLRGLDELFAPVSKRRRIFRRLGPVRRPALEFPTLKPSGAVADRPRTAAATEPTLGALADQQLLEQLAPSAVLVRRPGEIVRFYGRLDRYIRLPTGEATLDLLALARDDLKPTLRAMLHGAFRDGRRRIHEGLETTRDSGRAVVSITIRPLRAPRTAESLWFVIFDEQPRPSAAGRRSATGKAPGLVRRLEAELRATRREQQQLIEQLESSNDELKAAHEETLSMNEELQSANEELVTSKEELQSMNEELVTLNAQLQDKVHELTTLNDDLTNLLVSTDIATVFVDTELRITRFSLTGSHLLNLLPSDTGRPITHLATNLIDVDLAGDAQTVLKDLRPVEREVAARDGRQYLVRVFPYRTSSGAVQGIVLTLVDITPLKQTEQELRATQEQLQHLNQTLESRVAERTKWLTLMHDVTQAISDAPSWDQGLREVLHRVCDAGRWQVGYVYLPDREDPGYISAAISHVEESFRPFHVASEPQRYRIGQNLPARVYAEGQALWVHDQQDLLKLLPIRGELARQAGMKSGAALPVTVEREVIAVLELLSDEVRGPDEHLVNLMADVSAQIGRVLERERTSARMADLVWREQQGLLHTLHDSLGQTLTGLGMLSTGLSARVSGTDPAAADTAHQIARQAQHAIEQVRQLAKGLFPVEVDARGLLPALQQLAMTTEAVHGIRVRVEGDEPAALSDAAVAAQLYRIAQEAVTNAVRHANARTIVIQIQEDAGTTRLRILDDGVGLQNTVPNHDGAGLTIMRHRAASIGGALSAEPGQDGGTVVTCTVRGTPRLTGPSDG